MRKTMHKPIIMVDFGGVYFSKGAKFAASKWSKKLGMREDKIFAILIRSGSWTKWTTGKIGASEYWRIISRKLGLEKDELVKFRKDFHTCIPASGMQPLVRKLKKRHRVVVLSGNVKERIDILDKKYKLSKEFHQQHYSFDYGYDKPDVRLFKSAVLKMQMNPHDFIVIDDDEIFLAKVRKTGGRTILFRNAKQLEMELKKMGVAI